ncbi:phenylacetate--CoA ligase family protein [Acanthopleuribacter pedis]|uniref:AMP-binding protein n=1 Tax=Acanthopleuribacter pedis TaxID=442870 RepID=A0A8J7QAJ1_9BACT|nr:AMP-binding protein [Acanthopleuribacter pedis]MBO1317231.1 AMP-binding protein [Acanthopleuribacter pedis]MBO1318537.1 AMP-binding protein [Acanthopleuribacter pedis]
MPTMPPFFSDRHALEHHQQTRLHAMLGRLAADNAFYRERVNAFLARFPEMGLADFRRAFPFTFKRDLVADQQAFPPYGRNTTEPAHHYTRYCQTSGTTGAPLRLLDTPGSWDWMLSHWLRVYDAAGVRGGERIFFAFGFGPFLGFWTAFEAAQAGGNLCIPGGALNSLGRLQAMAANQTTVLCCTPTYALRLGEVAAQNDFDLDSIPLKVIIVAGEPGGAIPATRRAMRQFWRGARVVDHYGMTEIGPAGYESPHVEGLMHIIESDYLVEVIDPVTEAPASAGERGELVLTTLGREAAPVLRYRTGDLVQLQAPEPHWQTIEWGFPCGILGRADDMVVVRGVNMYPAAVEAVVRRFAVVAEYRVLLEERDAMTEMRLQVEPTDNAEGDWVESLGEALKAEFALRIPIEVVAKGTLPRFELKAKRWTRMG